jgi:hypothetical protein
VAAGICTICELRRLARIEEMQWHSRAQNIKRTYSHAVNIGEDAPWAYDKRNPIGFNSAAAKAGTCQTTR